MEPKIRFKGFEGEWKNLPFSDIVERASVSGQAGTLPGIEFEDIVSGEGCFNKNIYQKECCKYGKLFYEGDILFGKLRPYLKNIILADFNGVAIGDFWILRSKGYDKKYLYTLVNSESFLKVANISSGSKMPRADWNLVSATKFVVPSAKEEQKAIGKYFTSLDSQISASTSRLASLKQMKAASLQTMFPQEGETVPKVRFKGFEGEWKKVKLNSFAKRVTRKNSKLESTLALTIASAHGLVSQIDYFNNLVVGTNIRNYYLLKKGEFAYNKSYSNGYPFGSVKRLDRYEQGILSTLYITFSIDESISSDYLTHFFDTNLWHREVAERAAEGARNHGLLNIGANDFLDINIWKPKSKAEQQAIANYFTSLDRQITLQTQRLEKLKQIKSACLDKMFV